MHVAKWSLLLAGLVLAPPATADAIRERIIGRTFTGGEVRKNLTHLCDAIGGRMSGAPSGHAAEEYGAEVFRAYGLENVHFEPFPSTVTVPSPTE